MPRSAVAAGNLRLLRRAIDPRLWNDRLVVVVTNPVELVCQYLYRATHNPRIYGFGMASDRERVVEALRYGFGVPAEQASCVEVTGFHFLRPIPLLSSVPGLMERLELVPAEVVVRALERYRSAYGAGPATALRPLTALAHGPRAHELVLAAVNAITGSEFHGPVPPARRGCAHLADLFSAIINGGEVAVSGLVQPRRGLFLGGLLDLADGTFRAPGVGPPERRPLADDVAEYDRLGRQHLG